MSRLARQIAALDRARQAYREEAQALHRDFVVSLKVGDILYTSDDALDSWGYEQTIIDFYEVVEVAGKRVVVRRVARRFVSRDSSADYVAPSPGHYSADYVAPAPGQYIGPPMQKLVGRGNAVKIEGHHASLWDGRPKYQTAVGARH